MIVQKTADLDPAMKSALKNHIMRKRQQLKQELEQDAIEKRLKREQEAKRRQDAMTLDQLKEQLSQLERTLDNLKNEKHSLFAQLKQNMRVLNEDDARRKQKEGEIIAARQQQNEQNRQQQLAQSDHQQPLTPHTLQQRPAPQPISTTTSSSQRQQSLSNGAPIPSLANQENHIPSPREKLIDPHLQQQPPHLFHLPQSQQQPQQQQQQSQQQQSNHHHEQDSQQSNNSHQAPHRSSPHLQRSNPLYNSAAAFSHLMNAHNFPRQSPYMTHLSSQSNRPTNPYSSMNPFPPPLGHHHSPSLISGHGIPTSMSHIPQNQSMIRPSPPPMSNNGPLKLPPLNLPITSSGPPTQMDFNPNLLNSTPHHLQQHWSAIKRPISATSLPNESPSKKLHTSQGPPPPPPPSQNHPYLGYPGLPHSFGGSGANVPQNLPAIFTQNLIGASPPGSLNSLLNPATLSHLLNAHNFPPPLSHHQSPSLISGHGIPTSMSHISQNQSMIRPSPPPMSNSGQISNGQLKLPPLNLPITSSGPPTPMDFNPNLLNSTPHHLQQHWSAMNRPISATSLPNDSSGKKLHNSQAPPQPPPPSQNHPYLSYPGLPHSFGGSGANVPQNLPAIFTQNLMRTPPPGGLNSLLNPATLSHLLNAHNNDPWVHNATPRP